MKGDVKSFAFGQAQLTLETEYFTDSFSLPINLHFALSGKYLPETLVIRTSKNLVLNSLEEFKVTKKDERYNI